jgi:hypothetical protein
MAGELMARNDHAPGFCAQPFPQLFAEAGPDAMRRFLEFFTANLRNPNTRQAYARAVGITTFLLNGGTVEKAQALAGHESPKTTKLYDRTNDGITLDEVERILI